MSAGPGIPLNVAPGDPDPNLTCAGSARSTLIMTRRDFDIPLFSAQGFFQNMTVSFATNAQRERLHSVQLFFSTNGGATFTAGPIALLRKQPQQS